MSWNGIVYNLVVFMLMAACSPSTNEKYSAGKDSLHRSAGSSHALNNLKNSEHYENVGRINAKIIRRAKAKFRHAAKNGTDTLLVTSFMPARDGASLFVQFELIQEQAINFSLQVLYADKNCLFPEKYRLIVDQQSFNLEPGHVNRSFDKQCTEWADFQHLRQVWMDAISHASSVEIEFTRGQSIVTRKVPRESIDDCREAYEYYLALGGKF